MKINTSVIYFLKSAQININPINSIFKWMFIYCKCYIMIELMFLKELILIKQIHWKNAIFVTIGIKKGKLKTKKYIKVFESIYKNGKSYKIWRYWNPKTKISST